MIEEILFGIISLIYIILCLLAIYSHNKLIQRLKSNNYKVLVIIVTTVTMIIFILLLYYIRHIAVHYIFNYINLGHKLISITVAFLFLGLAIACFYIILKTIIGIIVPKLSTKRYSLKANIIKIIILLIIGLFSFGIWLLVFKSIFL